MSDVKMINFDPQKIYNAIAQIIGDRYGVDIQVTVIPKAEAEKEGVTA